jgi:hypothetical protein
LNRLILFLTIFLLPSLGFAQKTSTLKDRWRNSIGASFHLLHVSENVSPAFGVFYNPQINMINNYADFSLAFTMPISLGVHIKDSWIDKTFFYGQIPAVIEANIGHYATRDFRSKIGMGFGAGYGAQISGSDVGSGFVATVAARTWFFKGSLTIRYMFLLNLQGKGFNAHTIGVAVNMGNYFNKLTHMNKISKFHEFK